MEEAIKKVGEKWVVYPKKGGNRLGTHTSKRKALKQLSAIEISKKDKVKEAFKRVLKEIGNNKKSKNILEKLLTYLK